jgi:hypothetical protein
MDDIENLDQNELFLPEVPTTALMTDIDQAAVDIGLMDAPSIEAVPADDVMMGAEPAIYSDGPSATVPNFGVTTEALNEAFNPMTAPREILSNFQNMIGAQYPQSPEGVPKPEILVPTPEFGGAVTQGGDQMVSRKVGEEALTEVLPTAGMNNSLQGARAGVAGIDAALVQEADIAATIAAEKETIDMVRSVEADMYASRMNALADQAEKDMEVSRTEIARLRADYASQPWQSYWGSKDTGDKIMLAIGVGLGALGQAKIGGQNVAMQLLNTQIDDHTKAQDARFKNLESQLSLAQSGSVQAQQAIKLQFENLVAAKVAKYDQLDKQLSAMISKTNVPAARAAAEKMRSETQLKANKELFDMEKELAARTTTRMDIFDTKTQKGSPASFLQRDGQPMTEAQSKEYKMVLNAAPQVKIMEDLEAGGLTNDKAYSNYVKALKNSFRNFGILEGPAAVSAWLTNFDNQINEVVAGDNRLQLYNRALRKVMVDKLRLDSGASIADTEYNQFIATYLPSDITVSRTPEGQAAGLAHVTRSRRDFLEAALGASQSPSRLWYMEGKK